MKPGLLTCILAAVSAVAPVSLAGTATWTGAASNDTWSSDANWLNSSAPLNDGTTNVQFDGVNQLAVSVDGNKSVQQLTFNTGAGAFELSGGQITLAGSGGTADNSSGITKSNAADVTINSNLVLGAPLRISVTSGKMTLAGSLNLNSKDIRLVTAAGSELDINGDITGNVSGKMAFNGKGQTVLNGAKSYSGSTYIFNGTVVVNGDVYADHGVFGNGGTTSDIIMGTNAANLSPVLLIAGARTFARTVRLSAATGTPSNTYKIGGSTADTVTFSGNMVLGDTGGVAQALTLTAAAGGRLKVTGNILHATSASGTTDSVTKVDAGVVEIAGQNNTYLGATMVQSGALIVNGTLSSGGGAVNVLAGATLGGNGTLNRSVSLADGAILAAGDGGIGQLSMGSLNLSNNSVIQVDLGDRSADQIVVNGSLVLDGLVNVNASAGVAPGVYTILTYTGGSLTDHTMTVANAPAGYDYHIDLSTPGSVNLVVSSVPEPAAILTLVAGMFSLGLLRKRA